MDAMLTPYGQKLVADNQGLARKIARTYRSGSRLDYNERLSAAFEGLIHAAMCYDPNRGIQFSTYAIVTMKCAIHTACCNEANLIRVPKYLHQEGLAESGKTHADKAIAAMRMCQQLDWLDADHPSRDHQFDDDPIDINERSERISMAVEGLDDRMKYIIEGRFYRDPKVSLETIGQALCISKERVRQLERSAIDILSARLDGNRTRDRKRSCVAS